MIKGIALRQKSRKRFRAKSWEPRSANLRWKMSSLSAPVTSSGRKRIDVYPLHSHLTNRCQPRGGPPGAPGPRHSAAVVFVVVARDRALLSHAQPRSRSDRVSVAVLGGDRLRLWQFFSGTVGWWRAAISGILLPRRSHHDRSVHIHFHDDVGDRRPSRRISAFGPRRSHQSLRDRARQSPWRSD